MSELQRAIDHIESGSDAPIYQMQFDDRLMKYFLLNILCHDYLHDASLLTGPGKERLRDVFAGRSLFQNLKGGMLFEDEDDKTPAKNNTNPLVSAQTLQPEGRPTTNTSSPYTMSRNLTEEVEEEVPTQPYPYEEDDDNEENEEEQQQSVTSDPVESLAQLILLDIYGYIDLDWDAFVIPVENNDSINENLRINISYAFDVYLQNIMDNIVELVNNPPSPEQSVPVAAPRCPVSFNISNTVLHNQTINTLVRLYAIIDIFSNDIDRNLNNDDGNLPFPDPNEPIPEPQILTNNNMEEEGEQEEQEEQEELPSTPPSPPTPTNNDNMEEVEQEELPSLLTTPTKKRPRDDTSRYETPETKTKKLNFNGGDDDNDDTMNVNDAGDDWNSYLQIFSKDDTVDVLKKYIDYIKQQKPLTNEEYEDNSIIEEIIEIENILFSRDFEGEEEEATQIMVQPMNLDSCSNLLNRIENEDTYNSIRDVFAQVIDDIKNNLEVNEHEIDFSIEANFDNNLQAIQNIINGKIETIKDAISSIFQEQNIDINIEIFNKLFNKLVTIEIARRNVNTNEIALDRFTSELAKFQNDIIKTLVKYLKSQWKEKCADIMEANKAEIARAKAEAKLINAQAKAAANAAAEEEAKAEAIVNASREADRRNSTSSSSSFSSSSSSKQKMTPFDEENMNHVARIYAKTCLLSLGFCDDYGNIEDKDNINNIINNDDIGKLLRMEIQILRNVGWPNRQKEQNIFPGLTGPTIDDKLENGIRKIFLEQRDPNPRIMMSPDNYDSSIRYINPNTFSFMDNALNPNQPNFFVYNGQPVPWPYGLCTIAGLMDGWGGNGCVLHQGDTVISSQAGMELGQFAFRLTSDNNYYEADITNNRTGTGSGQIQIRMENSLNVNGSGAFFKTINLSIYDKSTLSAKTVIKSQLQLLVYSQNEYLKMFRSNKPPVPGNHDLWELFRSDANGPNATGLANYNSMYELMRYGCVKAFGDLFQEMLGISAQLPVYRGNVPAQVKPNSLQTIEFTQIEGPDGRDRALIQAGTDRPSAMGRSCIFSLYGDPNQINNMALVGYSSGTEKFVYVKPIAVAELEERAARAAEANRGKGKGRGRGRGGKKQTYKKSKKHSKKNTRKSSNKTKQRSRKNKMKKNKSKTIKK